MMYRWCLLICVWILQVSAAQHYLIRPTNQNNNSPIVGKSPPPFYLRGPMVPYFVPPPPALRSAAPSHLAMDTLKVPPGLLPNFGHPPHHGSISLVPKDQHVGKLPHKHHSGHHHHGLHPKQLVPNPLHKVPQITVTSPRASNVPLPVPHTRAAAPHLFPLNQSPLAHLPNLHPQHPLANKQNPRFGEPRHIHIHHHHHHGGADISHDFSHHAPAQHHHFHHKPHAVVVKKKTIIKKFRDAENQPQLFPRFKRSVETSYEGNRVKRALPAVLAAKLATDPKSKVDLMGTLDNVKDATKNICESIQSPVYHVRDAIGSARDVVFSVLKMSPTGILVPSSYGVMELKPNGETVGAINPDIFKYDPNYDGIPAIETQDITDTGDTLTAVQFMLRNGFRKGRDSIQHAGDAVHSMRRAILTIPNSALKLFYPFYKSVELDQDKDGFRPVGLLGAQPVIPDPTPRLVGAGRLLELLKAASASENTPDIVSTPFKFTPKSTVLSESKDKYKKYIDKLRNDVRERMRSLN